MKKAIVAALAFAPVFALAQAFGNVNALLVGFKTLVNTALPIVIGLALLGFFWGLARFIFAAGNEVDKEKGKNLMIWSIIALFVMVSVWGLVAFIGRALNVDQGGTPQTIGIPNVTPVP